MITQKMMMSGKSDKPCIKFTASREGESQNFFNASTYNTPESDYNIFINNILVDQFYYDLTFQENDVITIIAKNKVKFYPAFNASYKNYIKSIDAPFPPMVNTSGDEILDFTSCFTNCSDLISVPANLFKYNTNINSFFYCFSGCTSLTSIPADLFKYTTNVNNFGYCFRNCTSLTSIPANLFDNNISVTNFGNCFYNCSNITSAVPELWNRDNVTSYTRCFYGCYSALNYSSIPSGWK